MLTNLSSLECIDMYLEVSVVQGPDIPINVLDTVLDGQVDRRGRQLALNHYPE